MAKKITPASDPATRSSLAPVEPTNPSPTSIQAPAVTTTRKSGQSADKVDPDGVNGTSEIAQKTRHARRKSWFTAEMQRQAINRYQMALDEEYYDGHQWMPEEAAAVRGRGQNPVVYNEIKPTIDWMIGTESRTRSDFIVTSRSDDSEEAYDDAQVKTKLLKYLDDVNRTPFERSEVFKEQIVPGLGWLDTGIRADSEEETAYVRYESWRNVLHDSLGTRKDLEDSRYVFRFKEVDFDLAETMFPDKVDLLKKAIMLADKSSIWDWQNGHPWIGSATGVDMGLPAAYQSYDAEAWASHPRDRILLIECWETAPFRGKSTTGVEGESLVKMKKRVSVQTEWDTLIESWSPFKHNRFSLIPHWCYRRKKDGMPYGMVRNLRGPQDTLNKQMSKAIFRMATKQMMLETSAVNQAEGGMGIEELRDELNAPDGMLEFADGALSGSRVKMIDGVPLAEADLRLADYNTQSIRQSSGVGGQQRGLETNVVAAKGILAMQEQGGLLTAEPFDNARLARQLEGEITLSLVEQYYDQPKTFSVAGEQGRFEYNHINKPDSKTGKVNDVTARTAAFVIGEQAWKASLAEAAFSETMELLGQIAPVAPQVVINVLDLVFDMHPSLPNKFAMIQRIRALNGQADPNGKMTPEQQQAMAEKQQVAQLQMQAQIAGLQAEVKEKTAKGQKLDAETVLSRLTGIYEAAQAAQVLAMMPSSAPVADELLRSAGFVDMSEPQVIPDPLPGPAGQQPPAQPAVNAAQAAPPQAAQHPMPMPPHAMQRMAGHVPALMQGDGAAHGIETQRPDGVRTPGEVA